MPPPPPPYGSGAWTPGVPPGPTTPVPNPSARSSGLAIAALVLGVIGVVACFTFLPSVIAIVLGALGLKRIKQSNGMVKGRGLAVSGLVLGIVGVLAGVGFLIARAVTKASTSVKQGDCLAVPKVGSVIERFDRQSCEKPHDGEVVGRASLPGAGEDPYPDEAELAADVEARCGRKFERYTGSALDPAKHTLYYVYPTEDAWKDGDGGYVCIAAATDGEQLTGSLAG